MRLFPRLVKLLAASILVQTCLSQTTKTGSSSQANKDPSFNLNQPVLPPESLSGVWEVADNHGGVVGIHLELAAKLPDDKRTPWKSQAWQHLEVGIFQSKAPDKLYGETNQFGDALRGGDVSYKDGRLLLHYVWLGKDPLAVDLDLRQEANGCWRGRFHRNDYDRVVSLCRPAPDPAIQPSPLVGTWSETSGFPKECVHIAETSPGLFTGWSDSLQFPEQVTYAPTLRGPDDLYEDYGSLVKVELYKENIVRVEFGSYSPICCPHAFLGKLTADGSKLQGNYEHTPITFARTHADSCAP